MWRWQLQIVFNAACKCFVVRGALTKVDHINYATQERDGRRFANEFLIHENGSKCRRLTYRLSTELANFNNK